MKANYDQIRQHLVTLTPFVGNSMSATKHGELYRIYSYRTQIAEWNTDTGEKWVTPKKYSVTTSRQQNLVRHAWGVN